MIIIIVILGYLIASLYILGIMMMLFFRDDSKYKIKMCTIIGFIKHIRSYEYIRFDTYDRTYKFISRTNKQTKMYLTLNIFFPWFYRYEDLYKTIYKNILLDPISYIIYLISSLLLNGFMITLYFFRRIYDNKMTKEW